MKKTKITALVGIMAIVAVVVMFYMSGMKEEKPEVSEENIEYLESMQLNPPKDYIKKLTSIIKTNENSYMRERAIFTLTDVAIRKYETEKIIDFLKEVARNEKEDNVRTAAYANIDLIREYYPLEKQGSLELSILGEIKKNSKIKLIAKISSKVDVEEAIVGIDTTHQNIVPVNVSVPVYKLELRANQPEEVEFELLLKEVGEYEIPVTLILSFDRIDYEEIREEILLKVDETGGEVLQEKI